MTEKTNTTRSVFLAQSHSSSSSSLNTLLARLFAVCSRPVTVSFDSSIQPPPEVAVDIRGSAAMLILLASCAFTCSFCFCIDGAGAAGASEGLDGTAYDILGSVIADMSLCPQECEKNVG